MTGRVVLCLAAVAAPVAAQAVPEPVLVGVRGGVEIHRGALGQEHFGVQVWIPITDRLHVVPALDLLREFPADPLEAWSGRAVRGYVTLRARPFRPVWLPEVGYGLSAYYARAHHAGRSLSVSSVDVTDAVVFAHTGPSWRIRPYTELYLVNVLRRAGQTGIHFFLGLNVLVR